MKFRTSVLSMAVVLLIGSTAVQATGYRWLDTSPLRHFTDADWDMMRSNARAALDSGADGAQADWKNDSTGASGYIKVISSYEEEGRKCRKAEFSNSARGMTGGGIFRLCKADDGTWKLSP